MAVVCFLGLRTSQFEIINVYAAPSSILSRPLSSSPSPDGGEDRKGED